MCRLSAMAVFFMACPQHAQAFQNYLDSIGKASNNNNINTSPDTGYIGRAPLDPVPAQNEAAAAELQNNPPLNGANGSGATSFASNNRQKQQQQQEQDASVSSEYLEYLKQMQEVQQKNSLSAFAAQNNLKAEPEPSQVDNSKDSTKVTPPANGKANKANGTTPPPATSMPYFSSLVEDAPQTDQSSLAFSSPPEVKVGDANDSVLATLKNPLEAFVDKQLDLIHVEKEDVKEIVGDYATLLKKHMRLAITGGVPLNREMEGERFPPELETKGMSERIMRAIPLENPTRDGGGTAASQLSTWEAFQQAEINWSQMKEHMPSLFADPPPPFVTEEGGEGNPKCYAKLHHQKARGLDFDVAVCGGTLGIFYATALQLQGRKVCVTSTGKLAGRDQEWNISMEELLRLKALGVISQNDIDDAIQTELPGCRTTFKNKEVPLKGDGYLDNGVGYECFTEGVLDIGVSPKILLERVTQRFKSLGGVVMENVNVEGICVMRELGAALDFGDDYEPVTARLVIDAMGGNSPVTRQQRYAYKPDGVCVVVGTCASGYDPETNVAGDVFYTNSGIEDKGQLGGKMQYFWESFPVGVGPNGKPSDTKTTYMFTYMDAHEKRPTLTTLMEDYWRLLPHYQPSITNPETDLDIKRVHFAFFPTYVDSPLQPQFDRILAVGDASGIQSPLSFGGFGSLTRHLGRISNAVTEALEANALARSDLAQINPYAPNLRASWLFQRSMSVRMRQPFVDKRFVNRLLATNLEVMDKMGPETLKPFLQDVLRFDGVVGSVSRGFFYDPTLAPQIVAWVGVPTLWDWAKDVGMMGVYAALDNYVSPWLGPVGNAAFKKERSRFHLNRKLDSWRYGSGNDYNQPKRPNKKW